MESPPASQSSQVYIRLDADVPVHQVIMRASQLSKEQNQSIKGLLFRAKQAYLPDNEEITDAQLRKFNTEYVYAKGWIPGRRHPPPADQPTMSNKLDIAVQVGILLEDCRATPAQAGAPKSRTRANRKKFKKEAPPTTNPHRKKNSPIFFMISDYVKGNKTYHQVSFRDEKCQFLPRDIKFSTVHEYVDDLEDAYIQTLEKWDNFAERLHRYNLQLIAYYVRNRITMWSNGATVSSHPVDEDLESNICDVGLCYKADSVEGVPNDCLMTHKANSTPTFL